MQLIDIRRRMAKGAAWMVLFTLTVRSIGLVSTLILARLLVPADFGVVAMAMSIFAALEIMSSFSFDLALIQNQNAQRRHYDTTWTFNVLFGLANALAMVALAIPAAMFFGEPRVEWCMYALALCPLISGFDNVGVVAFQKDLELHKEFRFGIAKKLISFTVTATLAFLLRSYWALIAGMLAARVAGSALSYWLHPYRPRFSLAAAGELFHFSKWMLINNILVFFNLRLVDMVIGRFAGSHALGIYSVGYEIANLPTTELVFPIGRAIFPGYARMSDDQSVLRKGFTDVLSIIVLFAVPAGLGIAALAQPIVRVMLGEKWLEAVPLIQILALYGILRACLSNTGSVYLAMGRPKIITLVGAGGLFFLTVLCPPFAYYLGVNGLAWALFISALLLVPVNLAIMARYLGLRAMEFLGEVWRPLVAGALMGLAVDALRKMSASAGVGDLAQLLLLVPFGMMCYAFAMLVLWYCTGKPEGGETKVLQAAKARLRFT